MKPNSCNVGQVGILRPIDHRRPWNSAKPKPATLLLILLTLSAAGCAAKAARVTPAPAAPPPAPPVQAAAEEPFSVPQTHAVLPRPQPIQPEALVIVPPPAPPSEPVVPPPKSRPAPRQEVRQPTPTQPGGPQATPPRRIRPVASASERRRLLAAIAAHRQEAQDILTKVRARPLSNYEKQTTDRIQAFLDQTETALKEEDLQLAEALSSRAVLLGKELKP